MGTTTTTTTGNVFKSNDIQNIFCTAQITLIKDSLETISNSIVSKEVSKILNIIEKSLRNIAIFYPEYCYSEKAHMNCEKDTSILVELLTTKLFDSCDNEIQELPIKRLY